jgi:hypothetical protein
MKQCGAYPTDTVHDWDGRRTEALSFRHAAGADPSEWPADLRIQEFPA